MYQYNVEPVNGNTFWPKCRIPSLLLPPHHHVPIGRPIKKRRMHKYEIAEQDLKNLVKGGKMSKKGITIYGGKYGGKRHNRRGSTGPRDIIVNGKKKKGNGSRKEGVLDEVLGTTSQPVGSQQLRYHDAQVIQWDHKQ
ncbi:hypothetical protein Tco_0673724 [Tanacetum coccineum]